MIFIQKYYEEIFCQYHLIRLSLEINPFLHNVQEWPNILYKNLTVFTPQDFKSMFDYFLTLCMKGLISEILWNHSYG